MLTKRNRCHGLSSNQRSSHQVQSLQLQVRAKGKMIKLVSSSFKAAVVVFGSRNILSRLSVHILFMFIIAMDNKRIKDSKCSNLSNIGGLLR